MRPVRIQFDQEPQPFNPPDEGREVGMKGGFTPGQTHTINPTSKRNEPIQNVFEKKGRELLRAKNQGMVVAIAAAKVAARQEEDGADFPRPIDERGF
jgi:hypothetical protein